MFRPFEKFRSDEGGATAIEYGLIAALVAVVAIAAATHFQGRGRGQQTSPTAEAPAKN